MRDGDQRGAAADRREPAAGPAVEVQLRRPAAPYDFDVAPQNALRVAGAQRLHRRFLGREAAGEVNRWHTPPAAVRNLVVAEDPQHETIAVPFDGLGDTMNVRGIDPEPNDLRHTFSDFGVQISD